MSEPVPRLPNFFNTYTCGSHKKGCYIKCHGDMYEEAEKDLGVRLAIYAMHSTLSSIMMYL